MVVSGVLRSRPNLVPRALFLGFEAREKRPGDEVGVGHAPDASYLTHLYVVCGHFIESYVAVSRPCPLSEFYPNRAFNP